MELSPFSIYSLPIQSTSVRIPLKFFSCRSFYEGAKLYFFVTTYTFLKKKTQKRAISFYFAKKNASYPYYACSFSFSNEFCGNLKSSEIRKRHESTLTTPREYSHRPSWVLSWRCESTHVIHTKFANLCHLFSIYLYYISLLHIRIII